MKKIIVLLLCLLPMGIHAMDLTAAFDQALEVAMDTKSKEPIERWVEKYKIDINSRCVKFGPESQLKYPIEYAFLKRWPNAVLGYFFKLTNSVPIDGYDDYNLLLHMIVLKVDAERIHWLYQKGADPRKQVPNYRGYGIDSACTPLTHINDFVSRDRAAGPRTFDHIRQYEQYQKTLSEPRQTLSIDRKLMPEGSNTGSDKQTQPQQSAATDSERKKEHAEQEQKATPVSWHARLQGLADGIKNLASQVQDQEEQREREKLLKRKAELRKEKSALKNRVSKLEWDIFVEDWKIYYLFHPRRVIAGGIAAVAAVIVAGKLLYDRYGGKKKKSEEGSGDGRGFLKVSFAKRSTRTSF